MELRDKDSTIGDSSKNYKSQKGIHCIDYIRLIRYRTRKLSICKPPSCFRGTNSLREIAFFDLLPQTDVISVYIFTSITDANPMSACRSSIIWIWEQRTNAF